jgi:hypothetical protein
MQPLQIEPTPVRLACADRTPAMQTGVASVGLNAAFATIFLDAARMTLRACFDSFSFKTPDKNLTINKKLQKTAPHFFNYAEFTISVMPPFDGIR